MSGSRRSGPPLVADKRHSSKRSKTARKTAAPAAPKSARRQRRRRTTARRRGGPLGLVAAMIRFVLGLVWRLFSRGVAVLALILLAATGYVYTQLPPATALLDGRSRGSVTMLDREGEVFAWRGEQFGGQIDTTNISDYLKDAVVATEDRRFYRHVGLDPRGIASAIRINLREGRGPLSGHGGSTITQQTAKLLCLGEPYDADSGMTEAEYEADCRRTTLWRKAKEAVFALAMEARYSKNEILTIYLNRAYLGAGSRGFEAAAQRYFGKSAAEVNPAEAAMLAGLLVAPTTYAPTNDLQRSQGRAEVIVGLMEQQGYLSEAEASAARSNPAQLSAAAQARAGGYFADWVMQQGPDFLTRDTTEDVILRTTFDQGMQRAAEEAVAHVFETKVADGSGAQAAVVVMSADGAVRAMVGGRQFRGVNGQFNRAVQAKRQTGSTFKPFVYAAAMELGYHWYDTVEDAPLTMNIPGSGRWSPKNYSGSYRGRVSLQTALQNSLNTAAVRVSEAVGRENVRKVASDFGIDSDLAAGPALALGASEATLLETTGAYAGILNGGSSVTPYGIVELRLQGDPQPLMGKEGGLGERVISREAARELVYMMSTVIDGGTGARAKLDGRPAAGKTGTTQAARDAWFVGFTADYVAGVWMGYDDNTPLQGTTGGGLPAEIWRETMTRVHEGLPVQPLPMLDPAGAPAPRVAEAPRSGGTTSTARSGQRQQAQPRRQQTRQQDPVERVINNVLRSIFGG